MHIPPSHLPLLRSLAAFCAARGVSAWLVGGYTRDLLLGRAGNDIDLAVNGDGLELARAFADATGAAFVSLDAERGTGRVVPGARRLLPGAEPPPDRTYLDIAQL